MRAAQLKYEDIVIGSVYEFVRVITIQDVQAFAQLTGDFNPLHVDMAFGKKSKFQNNVVHGLLVGSLFSRIVGMFCPGERSLYLSQTFDFRSPVFGGDEVTVRGTVVNKSDSTQIVELTTEIFQNKKLVVSGRAKVKVLADE